MKYDPEDALREVFRRSTILEKKKERRNIRYLAGVVTTFAIMLAASMFIFARGSPVAAGDSPFGSFLLSEEAGGYVIVGVICFIAAIIITVLCYRYRDSRKRMSKQEDKQTLETREIEKEK